MTDQLNEAARLMNDRYLAMQREQLRKDKTLRAAAPDLLAALKAITERYAAKLDNNRWRDGIANKEREWIAEARAAIAKAEGTNQ